MKPFHVVFIYILFGLAKAHFNEKLKYFEIIHSSDISHQIRKRDVKENDHIREVTLFALGRNLALELRPKPDLFSSDLQTVIVDAEGNERDFPFTKNEFYRGYLKGEEQRTFVSAQIHDNIITAAIETENDTYHIEPAYGHIDGDTSNKMIVYRDTDVVWNLSFARNHTKNERFCGIGLDKSKKPNTMHDHSRKARSTRHHRSVKTKLRCELVLVADYLYYTNVGQNNKVKATQSMVGTIHRVDELFRKTDFSDDKNDPYKQFGFVIKKIIIHNVKGGTSYNKIFNNRPWAIKQLLEDFSKTDWSMFCLAHLFTYQDFLDGVIGLAYVANAVEGSRGGICSPVEGDMWHNTGLSSSINWGNRLLTTEADIVTAHEMGHNFGSEHDVQSNSVCSPATGGKYIMYPASVTGREPNNKDFSICSRRAINAVLKTKSTCFVMPSESEFCGNFRVEGDEECDAGAIEDTCCTTDCKFKNGAKCSDSNFGSQCCLNCTFANTSMRCSPAQPLLCKKESFCNGSSAACPEPEAARPGTDCIERGKCNKNGECKPFCQTVDPPLEPCLCSNDKDACFVCCKTTEGCNVYLNDSQRIKLKNGRLCYAGVCRDQKCEKDAQDFITRLKDFFGSLSDPSKFGEFLKDNIVGTVIVFSLIAWIPLSIVVHRIDKRRDKHAQELARWQDIQNNELIRQPGNQDFDVVFKKNAVFVRDSRKGSRGSSPNKRR